MSLCCSENIFKKMVHSKLFSLRLSQMSKQKDLSIESICVFFFQLFTHQSTLGELNFTV